MIPPGPPRLLVCALLLCGAGPSLGSVERGVAADYFSDDVLFDITWPGQREAEGHDVGQTESLALTEQLPNTLLGYKEVHGSEAVVMTTGEKERYKCVLPEISGSVDDNDEQEQEQVPPDDLLAVLLPYCSKMVSSYWIYELCHGKFLRQYHEVKGETQNPKIDEYILGRAVGKKTEDKEGGPPTWPFNGLDYPYYGVEMEDGTPCDLTSNQPRRTKVHYICDMEADDIGVLLHVGEVTTCQYEAVVATVQLCSNKAYRLKESPVHTVQCYAEEDSPRKPRVLLEHELHIKSLQSKFKGPSAPTTKGRSLPTSQQQFGAGSTPSSQAGPVLDETFITSFLSGDQCLAGGSGWWMYQLCFGQFAKQVHLERGKVVTEVTLGVWDEEAHKDWFATAGKKKQSKVHVSHLYVDGTKCDATGIPRQCQVRMKCVNTKQSEISITLDEPSVCNYILTVEASFICALLEDTDEHGLFQYPPPHSDSNTDTQTQNLDHAPTEAGNAEKSPSPEDEELEEESAESTEQQSNTGTTDSQRTASKSHSSSQRL